MQNQARDVSFGLDDQRFPEGFHICHVFNDDGERARTLARYFATGIREGERALCLVDSMTPDEVRSHLEELGIDLSKVGAQFGIAPAEPTYCCADGAFVPDTCLHNFLHFINGSKTEGYTGTRIMGDMSWALRRGQDIDTLLEYESKVNGFVKKFPVTAVCEYDARKFDGATIFDILAMHPAMIVRGQVVMNPFFEDPLAYYARRRARSSRPA